nr:hypothetical protein Itr_chr09CG03500 [Ipomoea trifida]GMD31872.1 hypothetical protein Iba_chr09bCG2930 [Ipomoea batatas]GMD35057.1 hypothetical protein Iba_chr09dCG3330 [Ipomoea batatas]
MSITVRLTVSKSGVGHESSGIPKGFGGAKLPICLQG